MSAPDSSMGNVMWKFFQFKKVKIASEIKQSYPFLHILRDKQIIPEEDFQKWFEKIDSNPETINEVIYNVLHSIKRESALWEIFCDEILNAYPNLKPIYQELKNVLQSADTSSASERKSNEVHSPEKNNPEISIRKKRMIVAAKTKRIKKKYYQGQLNSRGKTTGLPKEQKEQKKKNLIPNYKRFKLWVHCGTKAHGFLYKKKLAAGILEKSIKTSDGRWLTPKEFVVEGGRETWKSWKRSIRCHQYTLEKLIKMGLLENPPRSRCRKNKPGNHLCYVCSSGENLMRTSCSKSFHDSCHVPDVPNTKRKEWRCTFCEWSKKYPKNPPNVQKKTSLRPEEKALMLLMRPKQTLMCQYLLLQIWCKTGRIVAEDQNMSTGLKEVKEKLHQKQYEKVENFKRHMCQIFTNFQECNKGKEIAKNGRKLQNEFEKRFQQVFSIK